MCPAYSILLSMCDHIIRSTVPSTLRLYGGFTQGGFNSSVINKAGKIPAPNTVVDNLATQATRQPHKRLTYKLDHVQGALDHVQPVGDGHLLLL